MEAIDNAEYLLEDWWKDPSNRLVVWALLIGSPLIIAVFRDDFWAQPALQVYIFTFTVVAFLWAVRKLRWRRHTLSTLMVIGALHVVLMTGLVITNYVIPEINHFPRILYGFLACLIPVELFMVASILAWLGNRYSSAQERSNKKDLN